MSTPIERAAIVEHKRNVAEWRMSQEASVPPLDWETMDEPYRQALREHASAALAAAVDVDELTKVLERTKWETRFLIPRGANVVLTAPTSRQLAEAVRDHLLGVASSEPGKGTRLS